MKSPLLLLALLLPSLALAQAPASSWSLVLEQRIGSLDDGPSALSAVSAIVVDAGSEEIHIVEVGGSSTIKVFDRSGSYLRAVGSPGQGPGQFGTIGTVGIVNGMLVVNDPTNGRLTTFGSDGQLVEATRIDAGIGAADGAYAVGLLTGGRYVGYAPKAAQTVVHTGITAEELTLVDENGGVRILDELDVRHVTGVVTTSTTPVYFQRPFAHRSYYSIAPDGSSVTIAHQAPASTSTSGIFRIRRLDGDGAVLYARSYTYVPEAVPDAARTNVIERLARSTARWNVSEAELRDAAGIPRFAPPVTRMVTGVDGSVWLRREDLGAPTVEWWVLDSSGNVVGSLELPSETRVSYADRDFIWAVELGEFDVPYAARYSIRRGN